MTAIFNETLSTNQVIPLAHKRGVELWLKREDLIHPTVSGNKYRKLKYNLHYAQSKGLDTLVTFGGAFSNHITAVAAAGALYKFKTVGIIRGEELAEQVERNPSLSFAKNCGMHLEFVSRELYRQKSSESYLNDLKERCPKAYILPEGGTNDLAVKGCENILNDTDSAFDVICCAVGTGGTISGLINSSESHQKVLGFPALKGDFLSAEIRKFAQQTNWELVTDYHFGGYAKINAALIAFMNRCYKDYGLKLDPIYTGKMMYGIMDLIDTDYFKPNSKILAVHTGGLQGVKGMNLKLQAAGWPLINFE